MASNLSLYSGGQKDASATIKAFISNFVSEDFFKEVINICLYPNEFGSVTVGASNSTIEYIRKFFNDIYKNCNKLKLPNTKIIKTNIDITITILNIRETGYTIINYDNVFQHIPSPDLQITKLLQSVIRDKLTNDKEFRQLFDNIINKIKVYYEIDSISSSITSLDIFTDYASKPNSSVFEIAKLWKDNIILAYNNLDKLKTIDKFETEKDYFVIKDINSTKELAKTLMSYITNNYSFYKTGYKLFDTFIEGFESSSVHLVTAPSNHGKSLLLINLCRSMITSNLSDFKDGDAVLFLTLED